jgi:hypothetical protein
MNRKNFFFALVFIFPFIVTGLIVAQVLKLDSDLHFVKEKVVFNKSQQKTLITDKHASKRRVYFAVEKNSQIIQYKREYRGFITSWKVKNDVEDFEKNNIQSFYVIGSQVNSEGASLPFFGLNKQNKDFSYYADLYQFIKAKYFFILIATFLAYLFGSGWCIDYFGGITKHKTIGFVFGLNLFYLAFLLFW